MNRETSGNASDGSNNAHADAAFLAGGGEMGALIRSFNWDATQLRDVSGWPQSLRTSVSICLSSRFPMVIFWGPELVLFYNDAHVPMLGGKHPRSLGQPGLEAWAEVRDVVEPMLRAVMTTGEPTFSEDLMLPIVRSGRADESYFTFSYGPIRDESGGIGGVFCAVMETTERVIEGRRLRLLNALAEAARAKTPADACALVAAQTARFPSDVPFALLYLLDEVAGVVRLAGAANIEPGTPEAPASIALGYGATGTFEGAWAQHVAQLVESRASARAEVLLPIERSGGGRPFGFIVAGLSPILRQSASYDRFHKLLSSSISQIVSDAAAYADERGRAEVLAELDRAKTAFFSNVSHEFRTPLTLLLGPTEEALADTDEPLGEHQRERIELVHRNALRLGKLVNNLLDFASIEAGRIEAHYVAIDLATATRDLVSVFRSAIERAGLRVDVAGISDLPEPVYVDRDMWEKIVLNLVSNALKFTFEGSIAISLQQVDDDAELSIADTGIGIAPAEMPRLFERFHRIRGARARTHEGTGIGLALVQELARLHGGAVRATSVPGEGTTFFVRIKRGRAHLPAERIDTPSSLSSTSHGTAPFAEEVLRWLPSDPRQSWPPLPAVLGPRPPGASPEPRSRVLVADDNADMRDHLVRILSGRYDVEAVADGAEALRVAKRVRPDLVLADVMMPNMDGFELVRALRGETSTRDVPIMLLSARAGEEATTEGLETGADDYVVKPFSARELVARVDAQLTRAQMRAAGATHRKYITTVFQHAPVGIAIFRGPEHVYEFVNARYVELLPPKRAHDLLGLSIRAAVPELQGQGVYELLDNVYRSGEPYTGRSFPAMLARGTDGALQEAFFEFVFQSIRSDRGSVEGIVVVAYEVTELAEARRDAEAATRAKDEFLAMLGHELRNPLAPIVTALELMALRGSAPRERTIIDRQVRHVIRLVDDLLDISRITSDKVTLKRCDVDVVDVIADAIETSTPILEQQSHKLRVTAPRGQCFVHGDRGRLAQLLSNLLTNAAKYTEAGGEIEVTAASAEGEVAICVRDNGQGIAPELLPRVFDLFAQGRRTIDRAQGGLGLGLAIVKNLVTMHGGSVSASSEGVGRGSAFTVRLPLVAAPANVEPHTPERAIPVANATGLRVLVVDDNIDAAEMLDEALRSMGHTTRLVHDGAQAIAAAMEFRPEVALVDIGLPTMDGYEVGRRLRELFNGGLQVIAVTGYGQESDRARAKAAGFDAHLVKPLALSKLAELLERHA